MTARGMAEGAYNEDGGQTRARMSGTQVPTVATPRIGNRLRRGTRVKDYEILELIASGGFGDVYEAFHPVLDRRVALKILQQRHAGSADIQERFLKEARILAQIRNPHMVTVHDADVYEGRAWMAMELLDGHTLRELLGSGKAVPLVDALGIAAAICDGVDAAHQRGIVHRDLKPENVFLTWDGRIVVMDLGAAKSLTGDSKTTASGVIGTAAYMSPEQIEKPAGTEIDGRSDVYAVGLVLYEMLSGAHPFLRPDMNLQALLLQHLNEAPKPLASVAPSIPVLVSDIIGKALQKRRELRQASIRELGNELSSAAKGLQAQGVRDTEVRSPSETSGSNPLQRLTLSMGTPRRQPRRSTAFWAGIALAALLGGLVIGLAAVYAIRFVRPAQAPIVATSEPMSGDPTPRQLPTPIVAAEPSLHGVTGPRPPGSADAPSTKAQIEPSAVPNRSAVARPAASTRKQEGKPAKADPAPPGSAVQMINGRPAIL